MNFSFAPESWHCRLLFQLMHHGWTLGGAFSPLPVFCIASSCGPCFSLSFLSQVLVSPHLLVWGRHTSLKKLWTGGDGGIEHLAFCLVRSYVPGISFASGNSVPQSPRPVTSFAAMPLCYSRRDLFSQWSSSMSSSGVTEQLMSSWLPIMTQ